VGSVASRAVPVLPAVEVVRIPPVFLVRAVHEMSAIFSGGVPRFAVVVAFVADRSLPAVGVLLEVAPIEDEVIYFWSPCLRIIGAEQVFSFPLVAVPVFSTVVGVGEIPISELTAVRNMSTVDGCGSGGWWWSCGTHSRVVTRSGATVNIVSVGAPAENLVEDPRKPISKWFALAMRNCSFRTVIEERAGLWIGLLEEIIG